MATFNFTCQQKYGNSRISSAGHGTSKELFTHHTLSNEEMQKIF